MHAHRRRPPLLGIAACLLALLGAGAISAQETLVYDLGKAGGRLRLYRLPTSILTGPTNTVAVWLPPEYETSDRLYPVVYLLNGHGGDYTHFTSWTDAPRSAAEMIADERIEPVILVIPTRPGTQNYPHFLDYMGQELIPFVDAHFRTIADRSGRAVGGWSQGGTDAAVSALGRPDLFSSGACLDVWVNTATSLLERLALSHKQYLNPVSLWFHRSTESPSPSAELDLLQRLGIPHIYLETAGDHTNSLRAHTDDGLLFMMDHMGSPAPAVVPVVRATERFAVVAGAVPDALDIEIELAAPLSSGTWLRLDRQQLGLDAVQLSGEGRHFRSRLPLTGPLATGIYHLPVARIDDAGQPAYAFSVRLGVYPGDDAVLFDGALAAGWTLRPNSNLTFTPGAHDGRRALALEVSGVWNLSLFPDEPLPAFGYDRVSFRVHRGTATAPDGAIPSLRLRTVVTPVDIAVDLASANWEPVSIPLAQLGLDESGTIPRLVLDGNLQGEFYLADVRLERTPPPTATAVTERREPAVPEGFALDPNYPNPFNSQTVIRYALPRPAAVELIVYNTVGQRVATLVRGERPAGTWTVHWDGRDDAGRSLASGAYLYRLRSGDLVRSRRLLLLR